MILRYSLHDCRFSIDVDDSVAADIAEAVMPGCRTTGRSRVMFAVSPASRGRYAVEFDGKFAWHAKSKAELIPYLESEVMRWLLAQFSNVTRFHAAVVEKNRRAIVIAAPPGSGKTTLSCAFGHAGWRVMSDEIALLRTQPLDVLSFPRAMLVKNGTARRFRGLAATKPRRVLTDAGTLSIRYVNPNMFGKCSSTARPILIAFPRFGKRNAIEPVGEREALERLIHTAFEAPRSARTSVIDACVALTRKCPSVSVEIASARAVAELLTDFARDVK